jgi:hypothetical protein
MCGAANLARIGWSRRGAERWHWAWRSPSFIALSHRKSIDGRLRSLQNLSSSVYARIINRISVVHVKDNDAAVLGPLGVDPDDEDALFGARWRAHDSRRRYDAEERRGPTYANDHSQARPFLRPLAQDAQDANVVPSGWEVFERFRTLQEYPSITASLPFGAGRLNRQGSSAANRSPLLAIACNCRASRLCPSTSGFRHRRAPIRHPRACLALAIATSPTASAENQGTRSHGHPNPTPTDGPDCPIAQPENSRLCRNNPCVVSLAVRARNGHSSK